MNTFFCVLTIINSFAIVTYFLVQFCSINKYNKILKSNFNVEDLDLDFWGDVARDKK